MNKLSRYFLKNKQKFIEDKKWKYTANVYRQRTDKLSFLYAIITHENV